MSTPKPEDWQHRDGAPGYFITKDHLHQMLLTEDGHFVLCMTETTAQKGYEIVAGPVSDPEQLGIPANLLAEGEALMADDVVAAFTRDEPVSIQLAGPLAAGHQGANTQPNA